MKINPWLQLAQQSTAAQINLLCFPFAGGFAEYYLPWQKYITADLQLCPIQLPGRSYRWREPVITDIHDLLSVMKPALETLLHERPYVIFGHSMGGYISYEFCKILLDLNLPLPQLLVVSSIPAPRFWQKRRMLSELSEEQFSEFFMKLGGIHPEFIKHEKFIEMQMSLLRNDIILCESCHYIQRARFPFPIVALGGNEDEYVSIKTMQDWSLETSAAYSVQEFSGGHFYLNQHVQTVLEIVRKAGVGP